MRATQRTLKTTNGGYISTHTRTTVGSGASYLSGTGPAATASAASAAHAAARSWEGAARRIARAASAPRLQLQLRRRAGQSSAQRHVRWASCGGLLPGFCLSRDNIGPLGPSHRVCQLRSFSTNVVELSASVLQASCVQIPAAGRCAHLAWRGAPHCAARSPRFAKRATFAASPPCAPPLRQSDTWRKDSEGSPRVAGALPCCALLRAPRRCAGASRQAARVPTCATRAWLAAPRRLCRATRLGRRSRPAAAQLGRPPRSP